MEFLFIASIPSELKLIICEIPLTPTSTLSRESNTFLSNPHPSISTTPFAYESVLNNIQFIRDLSQKRIFGIFVGERWIFIGALDYRLW